MLCLGMFNKQRKRSVELGTCGLSALMLQHRCVDFTALDQLKNINQVMFLDYHKMSKCVD